MTADDEDPPPSTGMADSSTPEGVAGQRKKRKNKDDNARAFWQRCLADETGRAEIWGMLNEGGVFKAPFAIGPNGFPQPDATWFKAGQQGLVLGWFFRLMSYDFQGVELMLREHDPRFAVGK